MKYRDAKLLHRGDEVIRKSDQLPLTVESVEAYGQYKTVRINCVSDSNDLISLFNDEIE